MTTQAQQERVEELEVFADNLKAQNHYALNEIHDRCQAVVQRSQKFWDNSTARKKKLQDSKKYQLFLRNLYEVNKY